jgi:hypothetical protein
MPDQQGDQGRQPQGDAASPALAWASPAAITGILVLVAFGAMVIYMVGHLSDDERSWSRLVYVYGSVEAIVFAAAGALFGTQVQRSQTQRAEARADQAEQKADAHVQVAARGQALAQTLKAERRSLGPDVSRFRFSERAAGSPQEAEAAVINRLGTLAEELFPDS